MSTLGSRIAEARNRCEISQAQLARTLKKAQGTIGQWETNDREPDLATIRRIARTLDVQPEWLAWGAGGGPAPPDMIMIPEIDARAAAGENSGSVQDLRHQEAEITVGRFGFPASAFREVYGAAPEQARIISVVGDSMAPTILPGQKIMVDTSDKSPTPPGIFLVWDGMGMVIKRVEFVAHSDPPRVKISSDNQRYDPYERTIGEAYIQGRVVGTWSRT